MSKNVFQVDRKRAFEHRGRHGTLLSAPSSDLAFADVMVAKPKGLTDAHFAEDMAEIIGWWAINIYPDMITDGQGFRGMDCINIKVAEV